MVEKRYPFNIEKHAHDIHYRRNRAIVNEDYAMIEKLTSLLDECDLNRRGNICWLRGKFYGLAKETVFWADSQRANANAKPNYIRG